MMSNKEIREYAKKQYKEKLGDIFLPVFVVSAIAGAIGGITGSITGVVPMLSLPIGIIVGLASFTLNLGLVDYLRKFIKEEKYKIDDVFSKINELGKIFPVYILQAVFIFLWSLLLIIPGIIKAFAYSMVPLLYLDDPDKEASQILKESEEIMSGHKMDLFMLYLSFIPYHLLGIITCGLFELYVMPLQTLTATKFLVELKESSKPSKKKNEIKDAEVIEDNTKNKDKK